MSTTSTRQLLEASVCGDLGSFSQLLQLDHEILIGATASMPRLVLTASAVLSVLRAHRDGRAAAKLVCVWAWFVRRGFLPGGAGPIRPLAIEYEAEKEAGIVDALARLSELGDLVDGTMAKEEIEQLIGSLE